ncbi:phosphomannomutase/phosphoglucomutase [Candidatus Gribaldobacteria bacterium]|nr:phosphomannomutase/phosphoglucomutase [Candidatus Gribaldobacteria bacterium]
MQNKQNIFRAYDARGIYPSELNEEIAKRTAMTMAEQYPHCQKFVLSQDPRKSSPALARAIKQGFVDMGKEVIDLGIAPDPLFYFAILHYGYDGGIALSGSHNPKEYNGLTLNIRKRAGETSEDIILDDLKKIRDRVFNNKTFKTAKQGGMVIDLDLKDKYVDFVSSKIKLAKPLKIIIDVGNGACGLIPERVFKKLGCEVKTLFSEPDGNFPNHMPDPYKEENLQAIKQLVLKEKADIGFAFDTDGDRVAPIDNKGKVVSGDNCLLILARQALVKQKGPIVHCTRISQAFLDEMKKQNIETNYSVCHHSAVQKKIKTMGAVFGGEITYHYLFPLDYYLCDEAFFTAFKIAEIASQQSNFAGYIDSLPRYAVSPEVFIETPDDIKEKLIGDLQKFLQENNYNFIGIDGARIIFDNGWALARFSNTGPHIKIRFEGRTKEDLIEIEKKCLPIFEQVGIPLKKEHYQQLGLKT